uniref:hypothetical protein n=1 Tax=Escherichia coli TaxID=562 RepID=UPI001F1E2D84|nr:hypothetical protein [Escherichia coli]
MGNARLRCPFIQMLIVKVTSSESIHANAFSNKDTYQGLIHANAFQPKATYTSPFIQMLSDQRQLAFSYSCKCFSNKGTLHCPLRALLPDQKQLSPQHSYKCFFSKGTFSAAIEANAFIQKALFLPPLEQMLLYKRHFFCSPLKQMLFISLISNLSNFHLLSECYVISLGPSLACIFIKCRRPVLISQSFAGVKEL